MTSTMISAERPPAGELTGKNLYRDPYPLYARLRREAPVHLFPETGEWLVTRWADCRTAGSKGKLFVASDSPDRPETRVFGMPNVLSMSGQEHTCLRQGIDPPLQPDVVGSYIDGLARPIARSFIEKLRPRGSADLTKELFEPVSVRVVAAVMGLEDVDDATLARWFHALNGGMQNVHDDARVWAELDQARAEIDQALRPTVEQVTRKPDSSLLSHMVHGGLPEGQVRSYEEIVPTLRVFMLGGLQEPGHGAANAALGVLQDPEAVATLVRDPEGSALRAYDEGLRWIAPIGVTPRLVRENVELGGVTIPAGAMVALVLGSANRDETFFDEPDAFRMDRKRKQHASFGYAPHFCSGHYLGRSIGRIALAETFGSLPRVRLDPERAAETRGWRFRGVTHLPVLWDA